MDQPPWLAAAWAEFGVREIPGKDDAPEILRYFREAGDTSVETEATPWCAAFLGAMLKRAGCSGTGSLLARSYLDWGDALDASRLGAVAVLSRGDDPNAGHVGFLLSDTNGKLYLLGGNQSDAVTVAGFDKARLLGLRWPKENIEPESANDDTIFLKARDGKLDAIVTMYHDQGQVAVKLMGFERGVTVQGGLPVPITTPAHGTAFDIAGTGKANPSAMIQAFLMAARLGQC